MEVKKQKVRIERSQCRCSSCPENGEIWTLDDEDDLYSWCRTVSVVGNYQVWRKVVQAIREYGDVVFDDSGIVEAPNEE